MSPLPGSLAGRLPGFPGWGSEAELGETDDEKELIWGDPDVISTAAGHLRSFEGAFEETHQGLTKLDTEHWQGKAADNFRAKFAPHPPQWGHASDACSDAAGALEDYGSTVTWAQGQAKQAVALYNRGQQATQTAKTAYDAEVNTYNSQASAYNQAVANGQNPGSKPTQPRPFQDPGEADREAAKATLAEARRQRDSMAETAAAKITAATSMAPAKPSFLQQMYDDAHDIAQDLPNEVLHLDGGILKGTLGIVKFARSMDPIDPYNLTHPASYLDGMSTTVAGLLNMSTHPIKATASMLGSGWTSDPSQAFGNLIPNVVQTVATDGGGAAETVTADATENAMLDSSAADLNNLNSILDKPPEPWRPDTRTNYPALHAGSMSPEAAQALIDKEFPWMNEINRPRFDDGTPGFNRNCTNNVITVDRRLDGVEVDTAPLTQGRSIPQTQELFQKELGDPNAQFRQVNGYDTISEDIAARGPGSRGAVILVRGGNSAHVFNVINDGGRVIYLDGQSGKLADLESYNITDLAYMPYR
ncbi:putative T7SS-secreted protein [Streptacidiphilus sp. MAP5-3]|uniref:putative T7SS-secreted protein n=1 Tax=unclassified Streptacidiphilus TaxID=2643834 RepID=UPI003512945E